MNQKRSFTNRIRFYGFCAALAVFFVSGWAAHARALADPFIPGAWTKSTDNPVLTIATPGAWDDQYTFAPSVLLDGTTYKMWYAGSSTSSTIRKIGYAISPDGTTWTRQGSSPVLIPGSTGSWDAGHVSFPSVMKDGDTYKMWYTGLDASDIGKVGYATSPDGFTWTKYIGNPVLTIGTGNSWDSVYVGAANVIKVGSSYYMWYRGGLNGGIGYATSPDGITWTKDVNNPVIANGSGGWDHYAYHPRVLYDGTVFHMWYSGGDPTGNLSQVGYAISSDGAHWTRKGMVLPQGTAGAWDGESADHAAVLQVDSTLKMWYSGFNGTSYQIGYASAEATILNHKIFLPAMVR
ncbi:MAG: hypothetical protein CVU39_00680 [Chloroflexi bacterium HGW-Chloroflexi-10]|nr:MAG: hypothetical protein CVU39_00680 [Chloroflexi bacterium HGW-Chloroflexi-10]